jgi:hypothetical protein
MAHSAFPNSLISGHVFAVTPKFGYPAFVRSSGQFLFVR